MTVLNHRPVRPVLPNWPNLALPRPSSRSTPFSSGSPPSRLQISTKSCGSRVRQEVLGWDRRTPNHPANLEPISQTHLLAQAGGLFPHVLVTTASEGRECSSRVWSFGPLPSRAPPTSSPAPGPLRSRPGACGRPAAQALTVRPAAPHAPPRARLPALPHGSGRYRARGPSRTR